MSARPFRMKARCICMLSITGLYLGCRSPQDVARPSYLSSNVKVVPAESTVEKSQPVPALTEPSLATANDTTSPLASMPEVAMPEVAMPEVAMPDVAAPNAVVLASAELEADDGGTPYPLTQTSTTQTQFVATASVSAAGNTSQSNLELQIENVRPQRGKIKVAVFTDAENFLNPNFVSQAFELKDDATTATTSLTIDKPCAIAVFQDLDGNGQLTKNRLGIPVEPCAFSNNAVIKRGPPKFGEAMIQPANASASPARTRICLP